jgi:erythromycin esterase-like protein
VLDTLQRLDPELARRARDRYACFQTFGDDAQSYGYATAFGPAATCRDEAVAELLDVQQARARERTTSGEDWFNAEQNARLVQSAEGYYRAMFAGRVSSWNLRDKHMMDSLVALEQYLGKRLGSEAKIIVWAHNSHLGDARATEMGDAGEWNLGQLVRERWGAASLLVGQTTAMGTVTAANDWDGPVRHMRVQPALAGSIEALMHDLGMPHALVDLRDDRVPELRKPLLQRAIGVIYRPRTERQSHYFEARVAEQFDLLLHLDRTRALHPLDPGQHWHEAEVPDTYPFGV